MKQLFLLFTLLLLPAVASGPPLELDIVIRTSGDASATRTLCRRFARTKGWTPKIRNAQGEEIDNPETPCNFAERVLEDYVIREIGRDEEGAALQSAVEAVKLRIPTEIKGKKVGQ